MNVPDTGTLFIVIVFVICGLAGLDVLMMWRSDRNR